MKLNVFDETNYEMKRLPKLMAQAIKSNKFFIGLVIFFIFEALWIALTGHYPMAFDENFHLGIIKLYAHHINPFLAHQPINADEFGAVFRDPSYLYQFLMSFPFRLIELFTHDQTIQVIILRFINIGLFASALPLYRKLIRKSGVSASLSNVMIAIFILVPIVPFLAAQINYDNLLLPLVAVALLLTINFATELTVHRHVSAKLLGELLIICLLTSLVQYEFLPIFLAIIIFVGVLLYQNRRHQVKPWHALKHSYRVLARDARVALLFILVVCSVLFVQRYGVNAVSYKSPIPDCRKVLGVQRCVAYGPWNRNYVDALQKQTVSQNPIVFTGRWLHALWLRSFYSLAGPTNDYETRGPLLIPAIATVVFTGFGVLLLVRYGKRVFRHNNALVLWLFFIVATCYLIILWLDGYHDYRQTGQVVAVNGRYLLPLLLPIMTFFALAYAEFVRQRPQAKVMLASLAMLCMLWGGGALTYVLRSNDTWYWPNRAVIDVNHAVQKTLDIMVPDSYNPWQFII